MGAPLAVFGRAVRSCSPYPTAMQMRAANNFRYGGLLVAGARVWSPGCNRRRMQPKEVIETIGEFSAKAFLSLRRRMRFPAGPGGEAPDACSAGPDHCGKTTDSGLNELRRILRRDLSLATEHVRSIWWILEIARQHQQPVPRAALTNLDLVSKNLVNIMRGVEIAVEGEAAISNISADVRPRDPQLLPRPRPSCGCHVSPSDISAPSG